MSDKIQIKNWKELNDNLELLPTFVVEDINKRVTDWIASGGKIEDGYVGQQLRYAENVINAERRSK